MEVILLWLGLSVVVGIAASSRGRSGFGWFLLSIFFTPLLTLLAVLVMPGVRRDASGDAITSTSHVRCPDCRELVRADALKCKHCGTGLKPQRIG